MLGGTMVNAVPPSLKSFKARARQNILASRALPRGRAMAQSIILFFVVVK